MSTAGGIVCGIPSITLLGTKEDWQRLLREIDRLDDFGPERNPYGNRSRPLLTRFVSTFDGPAAEETKAFWDQMVHAKVYHTNLCGYPPTQYFVSGWILGFFYWDKSGIMSWWFSEGHTMGRDVHDHVLKYDDIVYGTAPLEDIPIGYAKAPCKLATVPGADESPCKGWILAGSVGKMITEGTPEAYKPATSNTPASRHTARAPKTQVQDREASCFAGIVQALSCFGGSRTKTANEEETCDEKAGAPPMEEVAKRGHSTVQPLSGWFLFQPDKDPGPLFDGQEVSGQTVNAINSCDGVKHEEEGPRLFD